MGKIKNAQSMTEGKKPLSMELNALRIGTKDKLDRLRVRAFGIEGDLNVRELKPAPGIFNIYWRIIFEKRKGCSHYYKLLYELKMKHDCWTKAKQSLEIEVFLHDKNYMYEDEMFDK